MTTSRDWTSMLCARMIRNLAAEIIEASDSQVCVAVPTQRPRWWVPPLSWIVRRPERRQVILEGLGRELWELCDGQRSVENIIEIFAHRHGLTFHEARVSVAEYFSVLVRKGVLAVALSEPPSGSAASASRETARAR